MEPKHRLSLGWSRPDSCDAEPKTGKSHRSSNHQTYRQSSRRSTFWSRPASNVNTVPEEDDNLALTEANQRRSSSVYDNTFFTGFSFVPRPEDVPEEAPIRASRIFPSRNHGHGHSHGHESEKPPTTIDTKLLISDTYFKSRRIESTKIEKPWLKANEPRRKWASIFPLLGLFLGLCLAGVLVWDGYRSVPVHDYCLIMDDSFDGAALNDKIWTKEAQVDGFGNGQFEQTTVDEENVFIKDGALWIKPTLQNQTFIETTGSVINLKGTCTGTQWFQCFTSTNMTNGTIVNPVKSGRINTKMSRSIQYGRVEVTAKLPIGDWLWPAIWMMPVKETYGIWPKSGEIDIAESRGNNYTNSPGGNNVVSSSLHWGPDHVNDAWWRTYSMKRALHAIYPDQYHTYGLEWSEKYLFTYIDSKLNEVLYSEFKQPFWKRGNFPLVDSNGTAYMDPWSQTGRTSTPFDQPFYLILNVAVGGQNGWFQDGKNGKPWVDQSPTARLDFWNARNQWAPTWEQDGQMIVKNVKMWQQKGYRGC